MACAEEDFLRAAQEEVFLPLRGESPQLECRFPSITTRLGDDHIRVSASRHIERFFYVVALDPPIVSVPILKSHALMRRTVFRDYVPPCHEQHMDGVRTVFVIIASV